MPQGGAGVERPSFDKLFTHKNFEHTLEWLISRWESDRDQESVGVNTTELAEAHLAVINYLQRGGTVSLKQLQRIQRLYPQALFNGQPENPETLSHALSYIGERMPTYIFRDDLGPILLSNNTKKMMSIPHTSESTEYEEKRKFAPARARWYSILKHLGGGVDITLFSTDSKREDPTDNFEILGWLGTLEQIRNTTRKLLFNGQDILPIKTAFEKMYAKHVFAEIDMINKKLIFERDEGLIQKMRSRLKTLTDRRSRLSEIAKELFEQWLSDKRDKNEIYVTSYDKNGENQLGFGAKEGVAQELVKKLAHGLKQNEIANPTDILFGNDFTIRLFLSVGLFDQSDFILLEKYFGTDGRNLDKRTSAQLQQVQEQLNSITDEVVRNATKKFFLVQQLSVYRGENPLILSLKAKMNQDDTYERLGIVRLVSTKDSPIANPVDVLVPERICPRLMANLPEPIRKIMQSIINNKEVILSVPYVLGNQTRSLLEALSVEYPELTSLAFVGKVGNAVGDDDDGSPQASVGELVMPVSVGSQFDEEEIEVPNRLDHLKIGGLRAWASKMMTTLALTGQEPGEMERALAEKEKHHILSLDMELFHLMSWYQSLPKDIQSKWSLRLIYYISDKTRLPKFYNEELHAGDKISNSLGMRGSVPLFLSLLTVLKGLAEKN